MLILGRIFGGHISGGHYNPAVTLAVALRGRCAWKDVPAYMVAQVVGAVVAGGVVLFLKEIPTVKAADPHIAQAVLAELLFTFALCYVVLNVAAAEAQRR